MAKRKYKCRKKPMKFTHKKKISEALKRYHKSCKLCVNKSKKKTTMSNSRKEYIKKRLNEIEKNQKRRKSKKR